MAGYYTIETPNQLSADDLAILQTLGGGRNIVTNLSSLSPLNTLRDQVFALVTGTLSTLRPITEDRELNTNHPLSHIYDQYVVPPISTGVQKSDDWYSAIDTFEREPFPSKPESLTVTEHDANQEYYDSVRDMYPSNINMIVEGATTPASLEDTPQRTPAIFYGFGAISPAEEAEIGYQGEQIILYVYAVVRDKTDMGGKPLFENIGSLYTSIDNLVRKIQTPKLPQMETGGTRIGRVSASLEARPLTEGLGRGEIVRFQITINWSYSVPIPTQ